MAKTTLTFYVPSKVQVEVEDAASREKVLEAVRAKVKGYQHPVRFEKTLMAAFDKKKHRIEDEKPPKIY